MLAKFLLIVYIGKYLSIDALGEYGLFLTTITMSIYFLGLDFYTYSTREMLAKKEHDRLPMIRDQFIFHLLIYVLVLPLISIVFIAGIIRADFVVFFYLILVFEHLSQELYRLYITLKKPIFANFLFFIRTAVWIYVVLAIWNFRVRDMTNLTTVWYGWVAGSFLSIVIGVIYLHRRYDFKSLTEEIDWDWIKNGVKISIPFFIGTLAYKVIEFSDRYMIDYFMTISDVGVYTFFSGIANILNVFVFTTVIMVYYPTLVQQYQNKKYQLFKKSIKIFSFKIFTYSIAISIVIMILVWPLFDFIDKPNFNNNIEVLLFLLIANIILNISFVPHYILYAAQKDTVIRNSALTGAFLNILLNINLIDCFGVDGAAIATIISFLVILYLKYKNGKSCVFGFQ